MKYSFSLDIINHCSDFYNNQIDTHQQKSPQIIAPEYHLHNPRHINSYGNTLQNITQIRYSPFTDTTLKRKTIQTYHHAWIQLGCNLI